MAERVRDERGKEDAAVGDLLAQVAQRQQVVEAQQPVACRGKAERRENVLPRDAVQMRQNALDVKLRKLAMQHVDDAAEDEQRRNRPDPADCIAFFALFAFAHGPDCGW